MSKNRTYRYPNPRRRRPRPPIGNRRPKEFPPLPECRPMTGDLARRWRSYEPEKRERAEQRHRAAWERWWKGFTLRLDAIDRDKRLCLAREQTQKAKLLKAAESLRGAPLDKKEADGFFRDVQSVYSAADAATAANFAGKVADKEQMSEALAELEALGGELMDLSRQLDPGFVEGDFNHERLFRLERDGGFRRDTTGLRVFGRDLQRAAARALAARKAEKRSGPASPIAPLHIPVGMCLDLFERLSGTKASNRNCKRWVGLVLRSGGLLSKGQSLSRAIKLAIKARK